MPLRKRGRRPAEKLAHGFLESVQWESGSSSSASVRLRPRPRRFPADALPSGVLRPTAGGTAGREDVRRRIAQARGRLPEDAAATEQPE